MEAHYYIKSTYGVDRYYPANEVAQAICDLLGTKTLPLPLNPCQERALKVLGVSVEKWTPYLKNEAGKVA